MLIILKIILPLGGFSIESMCEILRDEESSINFSGELLTVSSQISVINPAGSNIPCSHWFTGTPNPSVSLFKPFIFTPEIDIGNMTICKENENAHVLYKTHEEQRPEMESSTNKGLQLLSIIKELESQCMGDMSEFIQNHSGSLDKEFRDLFKDVVDSEVNFYNHSFRS